MEKIREMGSRRNLQKLEDNFVNPSQTKEKRLRNR